MTEYRLRELKVEVNRDCPLQCLHCSSNGMPHASECLDARKVSELIREFVYLGGKKLCISGGEPLCYKGLPAIINTCREAKIQTTLYTTGVSSNDDSPKPISDKIASLLSESGTKIIFSLHGANARTHDALTQVKGSFDTTIIAMTKALSFGMEAEVHIVPTTINFKEIADMIKLLVSFNIHKVSWLRFVPQGRGLLNKNTLQLSKEQTLQLAQIKIELQQAYPSMIIRTGAPFNILFPQVPTSCEAGLSVLTIRSDGFVAPCDAFKQFKIQDEFGSVKYHSLSDVWHKSYLLNEVRKIHKSKLNSSCVSCPLYHHCNSGCLAQKAIASGMLMNGKDPECPLNGVRIHESEIEAVSVR